VDDEVDYLPEDQEEAKLAIRESNREATLRDVYAAYREKGGPRKLPDPVLERYGGVAVSEIDWPWAIDVARASPVAYQGLLKDLAEILGLEINQVEVRVALRHDLAQQQEWQRQDEEEREQDDVDEDDADEDDADEEAWVYNWEDNLAETVRRIEQRDWERRRNWAGVTRPKDPPAYPPPHKPIAIHYPGWKHKNYDYRSTGIQYDPRRSKDNRWVYRPAEERGVLLKGRTPGRPANPNKLTNAEKQKRYRAKQKLVKRK
jgi:hypothetical protein